LLLDLQQREADGMKDSISWTELRNMP
jgi:hypothetical protein